MTMFNTTVLNTETALITVPGGSNYANVFLIFCNTNTTNSETITVHVRVGGVAAANSNMILNEITIDPADSFVFNMEKLLLGPTDIVSAIGTTGSLVVCTGSYILI